jgi:hypothetical protein
MLIVWVPLLAFSSGVTQRLMYVACTPREAEVNPNRKEALLSREGKRQAFWRSSLYEEPVWVSLAWIIGPALVAGIAIYFAVR